MGDQYIVITWYKSALSVQECFVIDFNQMYEPGKHKLTIGTIDRCVRSTAKHFALQLFFFKCRHGLSVNVNLANDVCKDVILFFDYVVVRRRRPSTSKIILYLLLIMYLTIAAFFV